MERLLKFLAEAHHAAQIYKDNIEEGINICLGNVSCDMDSAIGAILLAYYQTYKNDYFKDVGNYENFWIPVINCPRSEITARIDIAFHLKTFGIDLSQLVYIDDLDLGFYSQSKNMKLALIDHNKLDFSQQYLNNSVVFIVDHHVDMNEHLEAERILQFCGSACSQALNLIFEHKLDEEILTERICKFFSSAVLIDTENFRPSLKGTKWSEVDERAFLSINRVIMRDYFNDLINKKVDRNLNIELGLDLILKKDYKTYIWKNCIAGISVVFNPLHEIMSTFHVDTLRNMIKERMAIKKLNFYAIISQTYNKFGIPLRELMIYDEDPVALFQITEKFEKKCAYPLTRKKFTGLAKNFVFYVINDDSVSRKKIEPTFKDIFDEL